MKKLRCLLGLHRWVRNHSEEGQLYLTCQNCGKEEDPGGRITAVGG